MKELTIEIVPVPIRTTANAVSMPAYDVAVYLERPQHLAHTQARRYVVRVPRGGIISRLLAFVMARALRVRVQPLRGDEPIQEDKTMAAKPKKKVTVRRPYKSKPAPEAPYWHGGPGNPSYHEFCAQCTRGIEHSAVEHATELKAAKKLGFKVTDGDPPD